MSEFQSLIVLGKTILVGSGMSAWGGKMERVVVVSLFLSFENMMAF